MLEMMIWGGAALSVLGLAGLVWCIIRVVRARRSSTSDAELKAAIAAVLPINLAALFLSVMGLMLVAVGVILS